MFQINVTIPLSVHFSSKQVILLHEIKGVVTLLFRINVTTPLSI